MHTGNTVVGKIGVDSVRRERTWTGNELFGREKGAYTGAVGKQVGRFEIADGSSIFLDEIGELPLEVQAKLLRVLQNGELERLGSPRTIRVDVRVIAATNRDLAGHPRGDVPRGSLLSLECLSDDRPAPAGSPRGYPVARLSLRQGIRENMGRHVERVSPRGMEALMFHQWPGNIRELRNVIERAMILCRDSKLTVEHPSSAAEPTTVRPLKTLAETERDYINRALKHTGWRVSGERGAAKILGLKPTTLESRMKKLGIRRR